jgi:predicted GNAT family N-acyltransferase
VTVTVGLATGADLAAAYDVRWRVFVVEQGVPPDIERDRADSTAAHFLARIDGVAVGTGRLVVRGDTGVLGRLAVLPCARGRSLGAALVRAIEEHARARGLAAIELHAQTQVRRFYAALGYAAYGDEFVEAGIPHVAMRKPLPVTSGAGGAAAPNS